MKLRRLFGSLVSVGAVASLGVAMGFSSAAWAEPAEADPAPAADPLAPESLLTGPSLYETGKVGVTPEEASAPPAPVPAELRWSGNTEKSVQTVAAVMADAPPPHGPEGTIDPMLLDHDLAVNLSALDDCRLDVARNRRVSPTAVVADRLLLRWTIEPTGNVGSTVVIAKTPVDRDVMSCVKETMSQWTFAQPAGGPIEMERTFAFRHLR